MAAMRAAAAIAVLAVVLAADAASAAAPIASTRLAPARALFGDAIRATVTVDVDRGAASRVRALPSFGPLDLLAGPVRTRVDRGDRSTLSFSWRVACLSEECVPEGRSRKIVLPPVRLVGPAVAVKASWPTLTVVSRVSAKDAAAARPPFRLETQLPRPAYRVSPSGLALALDLLAGALVVVAALLAGRELRRRRRRREEERLAALSPLERALLLAREAEQRDPVDRRKALGLLAHVLGGRDESLAGTAAELAWSPERPSPEQVESLIGEVEREVGPS